MLLMLVSKSKMQISSKPFGARYNFKPGDVVCWSDLRKKRTGLVSKIFEAQLGGREVSFASVFCFEDQRNYDMLYLSLKLLSSSDVSSAEN